ncbi:MAG: CutA1 divalent ion tolerance protein [Bacteroidota bacterium]|jgi:uncharacterized protein involved in tolerance to divalent cations|nr:CutA1 divalent ion tolerance protein [Bacteroidota bacterium]
MINVYILIDSQHDARQLTKGLMEAKLVAHASIDKDNHSFNIEDGELVEKTNFVITGQTKALLFNKILEYIHTHSSGNIKVYSVPITQCNENFGEIIRQNTLKI